jgi:subtilisin-like proprotein convertase family protein
VRVWAQVTHTDLSQVSLELTHVGTGTTVVLGQPASSGNLESYSDDVLGDNDVDNPLSAFAGETAEGAWRLKAIDTGAGDTGTLDAFGIELT